MSGVMRCRCGDCGWVWVIAYLPMPVEKVARLGLRAACPMCACTKVFLAPSAGPLAPQTFPETPVKLTRDHE